MKKATKWVLWGVLCLALLVFPRVFGIYYSNVFVSFAVFALYALSFNLLMGFTGLLSFGHAMFFGTGAYTTALVLDHIQGMPLIPTVFAAFAASVLLALILCPIVVRVGGTAFAMLHLAFGQLLYVLALKWRNVTGGEDGIGGFPIPSFNIPGVLSVDMADPLNFFYFAVVVLGISALALWFFTKTPLGSVMIGIRDNPRRVEFMGFRVEHTKAVIYCLAAGFAGVAGSVYAMFQNLISAEDGFHVLVSFAPIMITMVGGVAHFTGPIFGSAIFGIIEELTSRYTERVELVMGLILICVIMYAPLGFMGFVDYVRGRWAARKMASQEGGK